MHTFILRTPKMQKKNKSGLRFNSEISDHILFMADKFAVEALVAVVSPTCFLSTRLQPRNVKLKATESFTVSIVAFDVLLLFESQLIIKQAKSAINTYLVFIRKGFFQR